MSLVDRRWAVWIGILAAGCGGGSEPTPPPPPPPVDNTRVVTIQAGDGQTADSRQAVPIRPAIKVSRQSGTPVAGVQVTFAVAQGGGELTGASQTTGSDGIATVGGWTLGSAGVNRLTATVAGATSGSPATFTATGREILVRPAQDTTMSGVVKVTRLVVPAGITITANGALTIEADSTVEIAGALLGQCVPVTVDGKQDLLITGTIDNSCSTPPAAPGALKLIGRTGYDVTDATVLSSGDIELTNDPTLTDVDFAPAAGPAAAPSASAALTIPCRISGSRFEQTPAAPKGGNLGQAIGLPGRDGALLTHRCRGDLRMTGGVVIKAQDGGDGGDGLDEPALGNAVATGGLGGTGGKLKIQATLNVIFSGSINSTQSGNGGNGGTARAVGGAVPAGPRPGDALATGGAGGQPGLLTIIAKQGTIQFVDPGEFRIGNGGNGGDATAITRDGLDAPGGPVAAQPGGNAVATGGVGGGTPDLPLLAVVANPNNLLVVGGRAGDGGQGDATSGKGGAGHRDRPDGANGGDVEATGGGGGSALLRNHLNQLFGTAGSGGPALLKGANGGNGAAQCDLAAPIVQGGAGGKGGSVTGHGGLAGSGAIPGSDETATVIGSARGGTGGDGMPHGIGGRASVDGVTGSKLVSGSFTNGSDGLDCFRLSPISSSLSFTTPVGTCIQPSTPSGSVGIISRASGPAAISATIVDLTGASGTLLQVNPNSFVQRATMVTRQLPANSSVQIGTFFDPCVPRDAGGDFTAEVRVTVTAGPATFLLLFPITGEMTP